MFAHILAYYEMQMRRAAVANDIATFNTLARKFRPLWNSLGRPFGRTRRR